jgi:cobyrinic acid a,c-diamide synthase
VIPGGYVETDESYKRVASSQKFKESLQNHAKTKRIYAERAGLIYLGKAVILKR